MRALRRRFSLHRGNLAASILVVAVAAGAGGAGGAGCAQSHEDRQHTLSQAGELDQTVASGEVVRDLRAPADSPRILYTRPTNLALPAAVAAAAPATSSTYGVSVPDSARARPGAAGPAKPGAAAATPSR